MIRSVVVAAALCLPLLACAPGPRPEPEPIVRVVEVAVPVPVYCDPAVGPEPAYADTPEAVQGADIFDAVRALLAGREQRMARDQVVTAALDGCRPPPQPG